MRYSNKNYGNKFKNYCNMLVLLSNFFFQIILCNIIIFFNTNKIMGKLQKVSLQVYPFTILIPIFLNPVF